ncbi:MAG: cytochrome P450 [Candidatus Eremiobacteraeota bacterium]|nr:cytochrome P450 [Candidatus Eremiobacteraeota bacterium]
MTPWFLETSFFQNPYPVYRRLREEAPVLWDEHLGWLVTGYAEVGTLLKEDRLSNEVFPMFAGPDARLPAFEQTSPFWILYRDPPVHTRLRKQVTSVFSARFIRSLEEQTRLEVNTLLEALPARADLVEMLGMPLPALVMAEVLGAPRQDLPLFYRWGHLVSSLVGAAERTSELLDQADAAVAEMNDYFGRLLAAPDRLVAAMLGARMEPREVVSMCSLLLLAGHDTTANLICNGLLALLNDQAAHTRLVRQPDLIDNALEEFLRFDSPSQVAARLVREPMAFDGYEFEPGQVVNLYMGAANRDPAQFDHPDRLDFDRPHYLHLAFGHGRHYCVGAVLARLVGRIALSETVRRFPRMRAQESDPPREKNLVLRRLQRLWVDLDG